MNCGRAKVKIVSNVPFFIYVKMNLNHRVFVGLAYSLNQ